MENGFIYVECSGGAGCCCLVTFEVIRGTRKTESDRVLPDEERGVASSSVWKSKLAWFITVIMGVQSVNYYCFTAWLPSILEETGMSFQVAGYIASAFQLFSLPATFAALLL